MRCTAIEELHARAPIGPVHFLIVSADPFSFGDDDGASSFPGSPDFSLTAPADESFGFDEAALGQAPTIYTEPAGPAPAPQQAQPQRPIRGDDLSSWERRRRVRLQARKVRRIIRHVEPWSVFKISVVFYLCLWVIFVLAGVMLWSVATSAGTIETVETTITTLFALDESPFTIQADQVFRGYALGGLVIVIAGTAFNVLLCVLFNLISDLMGGIRVTVIEEESARFRPPRRRPGR